MQLLNKYIELLKQIEEGIHPLEKYKDGDGSLYKEQEIDSNLLKMLLAEDLIFSEDKVFVPADKLSITPKGAIELFEWESKIEEKSLVHKFKGASINLMWLIVGAALTYFVRLNS
jgi:hypothetical protein